MSRVVVVGAGLAGLVAGIRLAQGGCRVTVVSTGAGGLHLSPGTIDVLGYMPERVDQTGPALARLAAERPDHPYAALAPEPLGEALAWFREATAALGHEGDPARNMLLPTAAGAARPTALAPAGVAAGRLTGTQRVVAVGLRSLKDFYPAFLAENLGRAALPDGASVTARALQIGWSARPDWADVAAPVHARALDLPAERARLAAELRPLVEPGELVLLPALVGMARPVEAWRDLQDRLGAPVAEVPTIPPSVPGMRLQAALVARLREAGGDLVLGPTAEGLDGANGRVSGVRVRAALRGRTLPADAVVLATGGFASGGIVLDSHGGLRESVAGLPVAGEAGLSPRYLDDQPLLRAGVRVDEHMRPLDDDGRVVWDNLHAAGGLVAGAEPWREKSGEGIAIAGGHRAASAILGGEVS
jgi:glycerol-3-phosphate dehydrogenase subunit B